MPACVSGQPSARDTLSRLTSGYGVTCQAVRKHVQVRKRGSLLRATRHGREVAVELEKRRLEDARRCLDKISEDWDDVFLRLRKFVEE